MIGIDTNVIVRALTGDHAEEAAKARHLIEADVVFVSLTVLLETQWVLRSAYGFSADAVMRGLRAFAGLPTVRVESPAVVAEALDRAERGMDFADALHLGQARHCTGFATFDQKFVKLAHRSGVPSVRGI